MKLPFDLDRFAQICHEVGDLALGEWQACLAQPPVVQSKADGSPVTESDRRIEAFLRERLYDLAGPFAVIGEEGGGKIGADGFAWVLDPIDGTRSFVAGVPTWTVSVGLLLDGVPVLGGVVAPAAGSGSVFLGGRGVPLTRDGRHVQSVGAATGSHISSLVPSDVHRRYDLRLPGRVRSLGSTAMHLSLVASGSALSALVHESHLWDVAGAMALMEAGGVAFAYLDGTPFDASRHLDGSRFVGPLFAAPRWAWTELAAMVTPRVGAFPTTPEARG